MAGHRIQFYDEVGKLAAHVAAFVRESLDQDGCALIIARRRTLAAVEEALGTIDRTRFFTNDADAFLPKLLAGDAIDAAAYELHVVTPIQRMRAAYPEGRLHIFSELADIWWTAGRSRAVLELEQRASVLAGRFDCTVACGYRAGTFKHAQDLEQVCAHHDSIASELALEGLDEKIVTTIDGLERRAATLENEIGLRTMVERRMQELLVLTGEMASAPNHAELARVTIAHANRAAGAVTVMFWLREGDYLELLGMTSPTDVKRQLFQRIPLDPELPVPSVVLTGEPIFLQSAEDFRCRYPKAHARVTPALSVADLAFAIFPLIATGAPLGAISFAYDHARQFEPSELAFKGIVARQCALALERIRLLADERRHREAAEAAAAAERAARTQSEHLYSLATAIEQTTEVGEVCELALETVEQNTRCDRAAILLVDPDGVMRFKAHHGLSATYRAAVDGHSPWPPDTWDPEPINVADAETDPAWASYREVFRAEGIRALAFVPLVDQRRVIGKIMLYRGAPEGFTADELQRVSAIAIHVALPIVRRHAEHALAIALAEERDAHQEAEAATRAREEILSVVSHDLRSPLGTILTGATSLLHVNVGASERQQRVRLIAERIHRQAGRMARLIEDLVDFASIQAGRVVLDVGAVSPEEILEATTDMFAPLAVENGLQLESRAAPGLPAVDCDSQRAIQVMSNLVSNALKVTPRGGAIAIGAKPANRDVVFFVRDTGPGIEPDDLPKLFERFWRSKSPTYRGAGLGLSIARGIVDAHGGRIWAESEVGVGSTFYFSLSSLRN